MSSSNFAEKVILKKVIPSEIIKASPRHLWLKEQVSKPL